MECHIAGLVLARAGSSGVPGKNVRVVAGYPLITWVLRPMMHCKHFSSVWVSTDCSNIASIAKQWGARVHFRSSSSATDKSSSLAGVQEFLSHHKEVTVVALVQCTSPCLTSEYLEIASSQILKGHDSVFSVFRQHKLRWKEIEGDEDTEALNFDPYNRPRRQDWKGELVESGHFYFSQVNLIENHLLQGGRCGYVEMPPEMCFEVDTEKDIIIAEQFLKRYGSRGD